MSISPSAAKALLELLAQPDWLNLSHDKDDMLGLAY